MPTRGRPRRDRLQRREGRLDVRVNPSEKETFKLAAENAGQDLSVWIRIQLHHAAKRELGEVEAGLKDEQ
jgi:predicted HicB family RNase H-like nuclease